MIRTMGDAIGSNAMLIPRTVQLVAPYITGLGDVPWPAPYLNFWAARGPLAPIDQGAGVSPRYDAVVIDIETGAYTVNHVTAWMNNSTRPRPTVYVNRGNEWAACEAALASPRFRGDVWLSFPGWQPSQPLPALPPGCHYVAIQNVFTLNYDLSAVIDDSWPEGNTMIIPGLPGDWLSEPVSFVDTQKGTPVYVGQGSDGTVWFTKFINGAWTAPAPL